MTQEKKAVFILAQVLNIFKRTDTNNQILCL
jgi:hypothetical protein